MRNWLKKLQVKGFVAGIVVTVMLLGTVVMANPVMREVVFGVSLRINGALVDFDADSRPFIMDGRTFLPVRTVADLFGADVGFDPDTNTVLLTGDIGAVATNQPTPLVTTIFEISPHNDNTAAVRPTVNILGVAHLDALVYTYTNWPGGQVDVRHNLGGNYSRLTGLYGIVDGSERRSSTLTIIADGRQLLRHTFNANDAPLVLDLDVSDVQLLTVSVNSSHGGGRNDNRQLAVIGQLHR